ncbi:MAG: CHAT domain-containing protein [Bacteroidota bacterium]
MMINENFISFSAEEKVERIIQSIHSLSPENIIFYGDGTYYLFEEDSIPSVLSELSRKAEPEALLRTVMEEFFLDAVPAVSQYELFVNTLPKVVVLAGDEIIGFSIIQETGRKKRGEALEDYEEDIDVGLPSDEPKVPGSLLSDTPYQVRTDYPEQVNIQEQLVILLEVGKFSEKELEGYKSVSEIATASDGDTIEFSIVKAKGVQVEGKRTKQTVIQGNEAPPVSFKFTPIDEGKATIKIIAMIDGDYLGQLELRPEIVKHSATGSKEVARAAVMSRIGAPLHSKLSDNHLKLTINQEEVGQKSKLEVTAEYTSSAGITFNQKGDIFLQQELDQFIKQFYRDVNKIKTKFSTDSERLESVFGDMCTGLFEQLLPKETQELIWTFRNEIMFVSITSEEPYLPWELLKLTGGDEENIEEGEFLCEAFIVSRSFYGSRLKKELVLQNLNVIVPNNTGLDYAPIEKEAILNLSSDTLTVNDIRPFMDDVEQLLASRKTDVSIIHFCGHGEYKEHDPNTSYISLEDYDLYANNISGRKSNLLRNSAPFVFLNCCLTGQSGHDLTSIGGFVKKFLANRACAFLGCLWPINDVVAFKYQLALYEALMNGDMMGVAVRKARLAIREYNSSIDRFAYTLYARPDMSLIPFQA